MKINKVQESEISALLMSGYSVESVIYAMKEAYPKLVLSKSDILIVAKKYHINKFGNKDLTSKKGQMKAMAEQLPTVLGDNEVMKKVKKSLLIIGLSLLLLVACLFLLGGVKVGLIGAGITVAAVIVVISFLYFKFVKGNKSLKGKFKLTKKK